MWLLLNSIIYNILFCRLVGLLFADAVYLIVVIKSEKIKFWSFLFLMSEALFTHCWSDREKRG